MKRVSFARIVSSADSVTNAFDGCGPSRLWWRAILWLHGKPTSPLLSEDERRQIVSAGFRFYAQLYRFVAVLFWITGALCWSVGLFETGREASYWTLASVLSGGFLWFATSLGFAGARALQEQRQWARCVLCAFMVAIIAFLSGLTTALSVAVQLLFDGSVIVNLGMLCVVWAVGIASYLIEVLYLVSDNAPTFCPSSARRI